MPYLSNFTYPAVIPTAQIARGTRRVSIHGLGDDSSGVSSPGEITTAQYNALLTALQNQGVPGTAIQLIPGVSNTVVLIGAGLAVLAGIYLFAKVL